MIKVYNDLNKKLEEFKTIEPNTVKIYVCGPTVYDLPHLGHARVAVAFDIIRRYLMARGYKVIYVSNYTDIDDKMINKANELGISIKELAEKNIDEYEWMLNRLNVLKPDIIPRATETIPEIISFIEKIMENGYAYVSNGSVYFDVSKLKEYDLLFKRSRKAVPDEDGSESEAFEQGFGAGGEFGTDKRSARDFALWKKYKEGEPYWDSPWGPGRPGWHIECSAMIAKHLGPEIDIHGGGEDLIFPHHTNEIAQTMAAYGTKLARYWLHNGFVLTSGEKMSKSLKNFFTVKELLKEYPGEVIRFFLGSVHYRKPIDFSRKQIEQAADNYQKLISFAASLADVLRISKETENDESTGLAELLERVKNGFYAAMDHDFNVPNALGHVFKLIKKVNKIVFTEAKPVSKKALDGILGFIKEVFDILGISEILPADGREKQKEISEKEMFGENKEKDDSASGQPDLVNALIEILVDIRGKLRERKLYELSDEIRDKLKDLGIELKDLKDKTIFSFGK